MTDLPFEYINLEHRIVAWAKDNNFALFKSSSIGTKLIVIDSMRRVGALTINEYEVYREYLFS